MAIQREREKEAEAESDFPNKIQIIRDEFLLRSHVCVRVFIVYVEKSQLLFVTQFRPKYL